MVLFLWNPHCKVQFYITIRIYLLRPEEQVPKISGVYPYNFLLILYFRVSHGTYIYANNNLFITQYERTRGIASIH